MGDLERNIWNHRETNKNFDIKSVNLWTKELIFAVDYLHSNNVVHRGNRIFPTRFYLKNKEIFFMENFRY
jgi:hypothetical protein